MSHLARVFLLLSFVAAMVMVHWAIGTIGNPQAAMVGSAMFVLGSLYATIDEHMRRRS